MMLSGRVSARRAWETYLARARWMTKQGYQHLLQGGSQVSSAPSASGAPQQPPPPHRWTPRHVVRGNDGSGVCYGLLPPLRTPWFCAVRPDRRIKPSSRSSGSPPSGVRPVPDRGPPERSRPYRSACRAINSTVAAISAGSAIAKPISATRRWCLRILRLRADIHRDENRSPDTICVWLACAARLSCLAADAARRLSRKVRLELVMRSFDLGDDCGQFASCHCGNGLFRGRQRWGSP
jgi:hypothetical protein